MFLVLFLKALTTHDSVVYVGNIPFKCWNVFIFLNKLDLILDFSLFEYKTSWKGGGGIVQKVLKHNK